MNSRQREKAVAEWFDCIQAADENVSGPDRPAIALVDSAHKRSIRLRNTSSSKSLPVEVWKHSASVGMAECPMDRIAAAVAPAHPFGCFARNSLRRVKS